MPQRYIVDATNPAYCGNTYASVGMPIFYSGAEFQVQKLMGRELIESLIKQQVVLWRVDQVLTESNFYGESKNKNFLEPVTLVARVQIADEDATLVGGLRRVTKGSLITHVYTDHLSDQGVEDVKVGDFIQFEGKYYEIYDNGPNDDENQRRLGVDRGFYRTLLAHHAEADVFSGR